jgi:putative transposase
MEIKSWLIPSLPDWAKAVPYQIKAIAVKDACQAVKQCKKAFRMTGKYNEAAFRRRHALQQSIFIPKSALKPEHGVYYTILGELRTYESIPCPNGDCRLTFRAGRWFVNVPIETTRKSDNQRRVVAIDPGIRTFATFYSPESCGKVGQGDFSRIQRLCHHLDALISRMSKAAHEERYRMKKAADRMRWKIRDLIDELHHKTALFFVKNFDVILIPKFETSQMSKKGYRKIRAKSVRSMLTFAHFRFQEFLKFKAWEYGKQVIHVDEAYTSKTCSWNGVMKNIGGSKKIQDKEIVVDRDYNGARGIFLRGLCEIQPFSLLRDCTTANLDELSSRFVM